MMRIDDDHDDIDLSRHRGSRIPGMLVIGAALGVALIVAWVFTPILISRDSAATGGLFARAKPRPAEQAPAPMLASTQAVPTAPAAPPLADSTPPASTGDQAAAPAAPSSAPAVAETTASTSLNAPWAQSRGIQVAAAPPADVGVMQETTAAPDTPSAEPFDNVPMPRKRPSRQIAASLITPLPRPRPEIEADAPAAPSTFDLQVERM